MNSKIYLTPNLQNELAVTSKLRATFHRRKLQILVVRKQSTAGNSCPLFSKLARI